MASIRLKKIEDTVSMLKSLERYDGRSETFMMNAIAYLEDYLDYMNGEEVKTVKIGNAEIRVHDDCYTGKTNEEIQRIIKEYCSVVTHSLRERDKTA